MNYCISIGVPLSMAVMDTIIDRPNIIYKTHYQQVNHILNDIAFAMASEIEQLGGEALPIPASKILDWEKLRAHLSHREIAYKAGLGWWGRNNLLVNEEYGSQVRLVTILTSLDLESDRPVDVDCGDCYTCLDVCPAGAIAEMREDFNLSACYKKIQEFSKYRGYGHLICGICLQHCSGQG
jgi:epoxyqueuosine reductase QueG